MPTDKAPYGVCRKKNQQPENCGMNLMVVDSQRVSLASFQMHLFGEVHYSKDEAVDLELSHVSLGAGSGYRFDC